MKTRAQWSPFEWVASFGCLIASTALIVLIFKLGLARLPLALLLIGAGSLLSAMSWAPDLLVKPTLPASMRDMAPVAIPRIAAFFLSIAVYLALLGTILAWVSPGSL